MKWIKFLLLLVAVGLGVYFLLGLIGFLYGLLYYVFWIGLIAVAGAVGYKVLISGSSDDKPAELEEKKPIGISEFDQADRALEEMRRKYLPEDKKTK